MSNLSLTDRPSFRQALSWALARAPGAVRARLTGPLAGATHEAAAELELWPPPGLARIDPSWFTTHPTRGDLGVLPLAIQGLPEPIRAAAGAEPVTLSPERTALADCLARWTWSHLVEMPPEQEAPPGVEPNQLARASRAHAMALVQILGRADLGAVLRHVPDRAAAAVCAPLPAEISRQVWEARKQSDHAGPDRVRLEAILSHLAAGADAPELLLILGASRLAAWLRDRDARLARVQIAQLLPVLVARHLLAEPTLPAGAVTDAELEQALSDRSGISDLP